VWSTRDSLPISGAASFQAAGARFVSDFIYQSELVPAGLLLPPARSGCLSEASAGAHLCRSHQFEIRRCFGQRHRPSHFLVRQPASGICLYAFHSWILYFFCGLRNSLLGIIKAFLFTN